MCLKLQRKGVMMRLSLSQQVVGGFTLAFVLIALISGAACRSTLQHARASDEIDKSNERLLQLEHTFSDLQDVEVGARGYVITGDASYRKSYDRAAHGTERQISALRALTSAMRLEAGLVVTSFIRDIGERLQLEHISVRARSRTMPSLTPWVRTSSSKARAPSLPSTTDGSASQQASTATCSRMAEWT